MLRLAADENFNNDLLRGLLRRHPSADVVRLQDAGLSGAPDPMVLDWAARQGRVLLTHDVRTLPGHAYERIVAGLPMPGVVVASRGTASSQILDDLSLLVQLSRDGEWEGQVLYLPLRSRR